MENGEKQIGNTVKALIVIGSLGAIFSAIFFGIFTPLNNLRAEQMVQANEMQNMKVQIAKDIAEIKIIVSDVKQDLKDHEKIQETTNQKLDQILNKLR